MKINDVNVTIKDLSEIIKYYSDRLEEIAGEYLDDLDGWLDIRLQIVDGGYDVHVGDASYDQDHRGYWGANWYKANMTVRECRELAKDLIEDCNEDYYMAN